MALKPVIYKLKITLSDLNRNYYETFNLTLAQHPSETAERMMARVLAFCIHAEEGLVFTNGLSAVDEPDVWTRTLDGQISLWIDVGEPSVERIKKATRRSPSVKVYSFNSKSDRWWAQGATKLNLLKASVFQLDWQQLKALATSVTRTMDLSVTLSENTAYLSSKSGENEVSWSVLQERN